MLTRFKLTNFKSYRDATLELGPLTLLIGANASGKSNALEGLQLLSWLAQGRRLDDIFRATQEAELSIRGTLADFTFQGSASFGFGCLQSESGRQLDIEIGVDKDGMRIRQERLSGGGAVPLYEVKSTASGFSHDISVAYNNFARGGIKPQITCTDQQAVFTQLLTPARFGSTDSGAFISKTVVSFMKELSAVLFLDPTPRLMRSYAYIVDKTLKGDGRNVSSVLYELCATQPTKEQVLHFIRDLPEQNITDIQFIETPRKEVMVQIEESFGGSPQLRDASVLSDGTLRVLAIAAALLSAPENSTVVIEEIDNGVHPSRAESLLANIERIAKERKLSVLLTTHNPALLDALPASSIPNIVFCYRDPEQGDSRLVRLSNLTDYTELVAQGPLGRLVTQGIVDRFVKQPSNPEEKKRAALSWIEQLKEPNA